MGNQPWPQFHNGIRERSIDNDKKFCQIQRDRQCLHGIRLEQVRNWYVSVLVLVFTRDLVDPVRIGSAIWNQMNPLMKVIPYGTVPL